MNATSTFYRRLSPLKAGRKYWSDGTPVMGQQFEYTHDDIGNRRAAKAGGDASGANLRSASYTPNLLNQYGSRTVPGAVDVMGVSLSTSATVNSQTPDRKGEYFRKELSVVNTSVPVWQAVTVTAPGETQVDRHEFVAKTPEQFGYDADGNLTSDGRWNYTWDAENRLIRMVANTAVGPQQRIDFEYDWQSRRIAKKAWNNTGGTGDPAVNLRFIYDGWNLLATLNSQLSTLNTFLWGLDLSGSMQGAGGVGGLMAVWDRSTIGGQASTHFVAYDGNGNVAALFKAADSTLSASYEYGPFAELLRGDGVMALANPFRFSTKYQDDETGLVYYGYRYYSPNVGRWLSRDPILEQGGRNLYAFVDNSAVTRLDPDGRRIWGCRNIVGTATCSACPTCVKKCFAFLRRGCNKYVNPPCDVSGSGNFGVYGSAGENGSLDVIDVQTGEVVQHVGPGGEFSTCDINCKRQ